jgi:hypothetical protein
MLTRDATTRHRPQGFDLDALVMRELDAIQREPQRPRKSPPAPLEQDAPSDDTPPPSRPEPSPAARAGLQTPDRNVIGISRATRSPSAHVPFDPQEEAFIERAVRFLADRPNADLVLNEIWGLAAAGDATQDIDPALDHDAALADDADDGDDACDDADGEAIDRTWSDEGADAWSAGDADAREEPAAASAAAHEAEMPPRRRARIVRIAPSTSGQDGPERRGPAQGGTSP